VRFFQVFYALACTIWTMHLIQILAAAGSSHPKGTFSGAVTSQLTGCPALARSQ
jgi:hypothetical protein